MKSCKNPLGPKDFVELILIIFVLVGEVVYYINYTREKAAAQERAAATKRAERERAEKEAHEARLKAEEEFERKRREARLAREREEEERLATERERKRLSVQAEAEKLRQIAEAQKWRDDYRNAKEKFKTTFEFSKDVSPSEKPRGVTESRRFWCAFSSYPAEKRIYEIQAEPGGRMEVLAIAADEAPRPVECARFEERMRKERSAVVSSSGRLFLTGVKFPVGVAFDVPDRGDGFRLVEANLEDFYSAAVALGIAAPKLKFKMRLCSGDGKTNIDLGVVEYGEVLARLLIEEAVSGKLVKTAKKRIAEAPSVNKKKKKMKRTAKLYDGRHLKIGVDGVTMVPRVYEFIGTTNYKANDYRAEREFRAKWQKLYKQAILEDKLEEEMEADRRAALEAEQIRKDQDMARAERLAADEKAIEAELAKCKIVVEAVTVEKRAGRRL